MLSWGDAVGNQVRLLRRLLVELGAESHIFAAQTDAESRGEARPPEELLRAGREDLVLVHHSFESKLLPLVKRLRCRRVVLYHNITPGHLMRPFDRALAQACDAARDELYELARLAEHAFAYSRFSAEELAAAGFRSVAVLPFLVDWSAFDAEPAPALQGELSDGCTNVLFVGRGVPSKRIDDVLRVFCAYQRLFDPTARLLIAGDFHAFSPYVNHLHALRRALRADRARFLGRLSASQLSACFATASVYLSMSAHEGFCVPLVEAMHREVPVVALGSAAVPDTLGRAGLVSLTADPIEVARLLALVKRDASLRARVLEGQNRRLEELTGASAEGQVREELSHLIERRPRALAKPPVEGELLVVCPSLRRQPRGRLAAAAVQLARELAQTRKVQLLTLAKERIGSLFPRQSRLGELDVLELSADTPEAERSSSLGAALLTSRAKVVALGVEAELAERLGKRLLTVEVPERGSLDAVVQRALAAAPG